MELRQSKYKTDGGQVFPVLVNARTELLAFGSTTNSPTSLALTTEAGLQVWKDKKEKGITTRKLFLRWQAAPPLGYAAGRGFYVPILTPELFSAIQVGQTAEYIGTICVVRKKLKEIIT